MPLKGADGLRRRLKAIKRSVAVENRAWGKNVVAAARPKTPVRSGRTRKSYRIRASQKRGLVTASYVAYFIDAGPRQHDITAKKGRLLKFEKEGRTVFARKVHHPGYGARPYRQYSAEEGLRRTPVAQTIVKLWNDAD